MARSRNDTPQQRKRRFEEFEQRLVMSAQAVVNLLPEIDLAAPLLSQQVITQPFVSETSETTQAAAVANEYGFDGSGQTVAVIDSGIAWDHYALGNGFGEGHKVVGGWDFAENDANPYDDGPAGFHGTHVSGIIGSEDDQYRGVSSGVDLVALRVFDDNGGGNLQWVEQALQWVHDHQNDFANPITTVNLSLGTAWNSFNTPSWATLENEFAQLKLDGIFISVAAGNSFLTYGEAGLSYPAVSEHVVPVASHDADGHLSDFSQRADNVLVAPGEHIRSTVPDHLFGGTQSGRFLGASGTSMAAPYVAGASAILRQANAFMGRTNINQDLLYQQFRDSADQIYDAVTGHSYKKINLEAALAQVIVDHHGDTADTATVIDNLQTGTQITGTIGKLTDVDQFQFTAQSDGQVTLHFTTTHQLDALVEVVGAEAQFNGNEVTFSVESGKTYHFAVATRDGNGHYTIDASVTTAGGSTTGGSEASGSQGAEMNAGNQWGVIESSRFAGYTVNGESIFALQAGRDGFLTIESGAQNGALQLEIYDAQMNRVAATVASSAQARLDIVANSGETYYVKAIGQASGVTFGAHNLVTLESGQLAIHGTESDNVIQIDVNDRFSIDIDGLDYTFEASEVQAMTIDGHAGHDTIAMHLGSGNDWVTTMSDGLAVFNQSYHARATGFETTQVDGGGGTNMVWMYGTYADESFQGSNESSTLSGNGYSSTATHFSKTYAVGQGGNDSARIEGTSGSDYFVSRNGRSTMYSDSVVSAADFDNTVLDGGGGYDQIQLYDSAGNDQFFIKPNEARMTHGSESVTATGFEAINAFSTSGHDTLSMHDSAGHDTFSYDQGQVHLSGTGFAISADGFHNVAITSMGGYDRANITDTAGNDFFRSEGKTASMSSSTDSLRMDGFEVVNVSAVYGGYDQSILIGSTGADWLYASGKFVSVGTSDGFARNMSGFDTTQVDLRSGIDFATILGTAGDDRFEAGYSRLEFESTLQMLRMVNVEHSAFDGNGGDDDVHIEDFQTRDLLRSIGDKATAYLRDHSVTVSDLDYLETQTVDHAIADYNLESVDFRYAFRGNWNRID